MRMRFSWFWSPEDVRRKEKWIELDGENEMQIERLIRGIAKAGFPVLVEELICYGR